MEKNWIPRCHTAWSAILSYLSWDSLASCANEITKRSAMGDSIPDYLWAIATQPIFTRIDSLRKHLQRAAVTSESEYYFP